MELWVPVRLDGFPAQRRDFVRQRTALSLALNAMKVCRAGWLHQPSWGSFADPRGDWREKLEGSSQHCAGTGPMGSVRDLGH